MIETNDYYPFGKRIQATGPVAEPVEATSPNRWLFSGKEDQSFLSAGIPLLDFGARMYNPAIARWTAIDPLADEYYNVSPYAYCLGNPIRNIDILGLRPIYSTEGYLLGTDDGGIQGEQIIMKKDNFVQGMRTEDALKYNLGVEGLDSLSEVVELIHVRFPFENRCLVISLERQANHLRVIGKVEHKGENNAVRSHFLYIVY